MILRGLMMIDSGFTKSAFHFVLNHAVGNSITSIEVWGCDYVANLSLVLAEFGQSTTLPISVVAGKRCRLE